MLPARNEAQTIYDSIVQFHQFLPNAIICIIDNDSEDDTQSVAKQAIKEHQIDGVFLFEPLVGKGYAIQRGLSEVDADIYVLCDADLTYPIEDVAKLIQPILAGDADMVMGDRLSGGHYSTQNKRRFHCVGNKLITKLTNIFFNQSFIDVSTGYRVLSRSFVEGYKVKAKGFELEIDLAIHAANFDLSVREIPIGYTSRPDGSFSKLSTFRDGLANLRFLVSRFFQDHFEKVKNRRSCAMR